ncbi:MAG: hypothetical protein ACKVUS_10540 [Saprospiraceae bacterium]
MTEQRPPVDPSEWLYRRGHSSPEKKYMNPDGTATSRVFKLREKDHGELSVDVRSMTTPKISVGDDSKFMLFEIANQDVLNVGLRTFHDPCTVASHGFDNPAHAALVGMDMEDDVLPGMLARKSRRVNFE